MGENPKIKPIPELAFGVVLRAMIGVYRVRFGRHWRTKIGVYGGGKAVKNWARFHPPQSSSTALGPGPLHELS